MMWLEFETRMRSLIRRVIEPALKLSVEDRETNIDLEYKMQQLAVRCDILEETVLKKDNTNKRTIFDDFQDKLSEVSIYLKQQTKQLSDTLALNHAST